MKKLILILLLADHFAHAAVVDTDKGQLRGREAFGVQIFKSIPYAKPPVGELRWKPPVEMDHWDGVKNVWFTQRECSQPSDIIPNLYRGSEDCLTLDVWSTDLYAKKPVMVFIHGGEFVNGNADGVDIFHIYDSKHLANFTNVVVVSINYRLGPLGFLSLPELEAKGGTSGNYGLLDQIAALKWVQKNISNFGGDPSRVTIFGESAGAASVLALMTTPLAQGLFQGAIVESGYYSQQTKTKGDQRSQRLAQALGCAKQNSTQVDLNCMRNQSAADLTMTLGRLDKNSVAQANADTFTPIIDGVNWTQDVLSVFQAHLQIQVPMIIGSNRDETLWLTSFLFGPPVQNDDQFEQLVVNATKDFKSGGEPFWNSIKPFYNSSLYQGNAQSALVGLSSDMLFNCPTRQIADAAADSGQKVWRYVYTHTDASAFLKPLKASHVMELLYVFHRVSVFFGFDDAERALSDFIENTWSEIPNSGTVSDWPLYDSKQRNYLQLDTPTSTSSGFHDAQCDAINKTGISLL